MTDFHDLQLKEQLLLQQKWEDDVDVDEGNVCDFCVRSVKPNKFFDQTPVGTHRDEPVGTHRYLYAMVNGDINKRFPEWALEV